MYRWTHNEECRNHAKPAEPKKLFKEYISNGSARGADNGLQTDALHSYNQRTSRDSGLSTDDGFDNLVDNGIDSTDGCANTCNSLSDNVLRANCDNQRLEIERLEKCTQTDVAELDISAVEMASPVRIPAAPPLPGHLLVPAGSSTPIRSAQTKETAAPSSVSTPPAPPILQKTASRTILSSASSFCAPDQTKSIPCPPPMPCPPPLPHIAGPGKNSK